LNRIGLLGGSFDPPHKGHLYISLEAKKILSLDEIWWLITPKNPLKINNPATYEERKKNCYKICRNFPIKIKEIEKKINSSYSYKTIKYLKKHYQHQKFFWLMGSDNLINFHKWENWRKIFQEISIIVFKRQGYNDKALNSITKKTFSNYHIKYNHMLLTNFEILPSWCFLNNYEIKISSSDIRNQREKLRSLNHSN
tara:strand:+ start:610 stop:1200 length:591 start_codon:yes stop_codon:yes gene_type:complete